MPTWLAAAARRAWDLNISDEPMSRTILVRPESLFGYGRASYELNFGCNYDCEHCYLGLKRFDGLSWPDRERLLHIMRDAGVLWLQLTGGESMIDRLFTQVYDLTYGIGISAFRMFEKGLYAEHGAGLPLALSMIVTKHNAQRKEDAG